MKDWVMIHKIRAMHDSGDGASIKQISRFYKLSRNTVRKLRILVNLITHSGLR